MRRRHRASAQRDTHLGTHRGGPPATAVLVAALITACSGTSPATSSQPSASSPSTSATQTGTLRGRLATVGGAAPGTAWPISGTVTVTGTAPPLHVAVATDGVYTLSLPPGRYTVTGTSPQYIVNGRAATCSRPGRRRRRTHRHR